MVAAFTPLTRIRHASS